MTTHSQDSAAEQGRVSSEVLDGTATITFSHPKGNSLPGALLRQMAAEIAAIGTREDVNVVVLQSGGSGPFCAGASFDELRTIADPDGGREFFMGFARLILAMRGCPRPIIARVHGKAVGGGVGVVAAADYTIATRSAGLRLSELAVGIGPFVVGPAIERKIGAGPFGAMAVDADWRDAEWGERHGLYARLVDDVAGLDEAVNALARRLAGFSPDALATIKRVTWEGTGHWERLLPERAEMSGTLVLSEFTRNAIAAFSQR